MHHPTFSDLLNMAEGVVLYPVPIVTIRYDPHDDLQANADILPPLTRLSLAELPTAKINRPHVNSDTDIASSTSYHPDSLTYSSPADTPNPRLPTPHPFALTASNPSLPPLHWSTPTVPFTHRLRVENRLFDFIMEQVSSSATELQTAKWIHSYWLEQGKCLVGTDDLMGPQLPAWYPSESTPVASKA
ncbi:hypothetical protein JAAARDRAFT_198316 [Jaapia argillacea MUCL 33604]|uniref:Uncharacterized protein n=1 Tax=Jaapia argillacea MUCL 33604 TaxID=933084 RepID=A0A067PBW2_9AGAM|nr:hypothetical protein JAAARDRAFT_198316 [Jaapia argillacea MUCL 33604]